MERFEHVESAACEQSHATLPAVGDCPQLCVELCQTLVDELVMRFMVRVTREEFWLVDIEHNARQFLCGCK